MLVHMQEEARDHNAMTMKKKMMPIIRWMGNKNYICGRHFVIVAVLWYLVNAITQRLMDGRRWDGQMDGTEDLHSPVIFTS